MNELQMTDLEFLKRDLTLRGYDEAEVAKLIDIPVLLIPGALTSDEAVEPAQKLTNHIVFLSKDLKRDGIPNQVVLRKNLPHKYIEERHANVDLGTIIVSVLTAQQIGLFADIAQIMSFILNLIELRFSRNRTDNLMPNVKFEFEAHNRKKIARIKVEGPADQITRILSPSRIQAMINHLHDENKSE